MPKHLNSRNIFFIRHGQSESNVNEHMAAGSHKDAALTELGKKQAEALGERFKREGIYLDYLFLHQAEGIVLILKLLSLLSLLIQQHINHLFLLQL